MKQLISFLSYHNAVPAVLVVLALGAGSAFAATATGVIDVPAVFAQKAPAADGSGGPREVDVSALLFADIDAFDFRPTVTGVVETDIAYTVSYSLQTLAPDGGAWAPYAKTGEFTVAKNALPDTGLQGYVVQKLKDIENGERSYLSRAQAAEKELAADRAAKPANAFAALVGLALDQISVPVVEKPIPEPQSQTPEQPTASPPVVQQDAVASSPAEQSATTTLGTATTATTSEGTATSTDAVTPDSTSSATTTLPTGTASSAESTSTPPEATTSIPNTDASSTQL